MEKANLNAVILGIFFRNIALDGAVFAAIVAFGFLQGWFSEPIRYRYLGNACLLAGLSLLVLSVFSVLLRRTDLMGQDAYPSQSSFSDLSSLSAGDAPGAMPVVSPADGKANFWQIYAASLSLALAGIDTLMVGIVLEVVGR